MEKSREINGWKAKNFKIKTEAGKHSRSNLLTTYDKVLRLQCILCSEGMYPASWELTIHRRMKKSRVVYCKKNFFWGGALSRGLFRTFACGSFRSWTIQSTPSKLPHKNPNYIRDTSAPFLDRWLNCASLVCHWRHAQRQPPGSRLGQVGQVGQVGPVGPVGPVGLKTLPRRHA